MRKAETFAVIMTVVLILVWAVGVGVTIGIQLNNPDNACQEDESCWNCTTMGNKICGPLTEGN